LKRSLADDVQGKWLPQAARYLKFPKIKLQNND